jgi:hypothetical protein
LASVLGKMREALEQMLVPSPLDPWHAAAQHVAAEHQDIIDQDGSGATSGASVLAEVVDAVRGGGSGGEPLTLDFTHRIAAKQMYVRHALGERPCSVCSSVCVRTHHIIPFIHPLCSPSIPYLHIFTPIIHVYTPYIHLYKPLNNLYTPKYTINWYMIGTPGWLPT